MAVSRNLEDLLPSWNVDPTTRPPYFPFNTLADFEQTKLFVKDNHTDGGINRQLDFWRHHGLPNAGVTLKNAREMHKCLKTAGLEEDILQVTSPDIILRNIQLMTQPGV